MTDDRPAISSSVMESRFSSTIHDRSSEGNSDKREEAEPSETQVPAARHERSPSQLHNFLQDAIEATSPPLRNLASHSTLGSLYSYGTSDVRSHRSKPSNGSSFRTMSTNFEEQRHVGKPGVSITRSTKTWDPIIAQLPTSDSMSSFQGPSRRISHLSGAEQSFVTQSGVSTQMYSSTPLVAEEHRKDAAEIFESGGNGAMEEEDGNVYPGPLQLAVLIIGLCLSVFIISLDRTIITTVCLFQAPFSLNC